MPVRNSVSVKCFDHLCTFSRQINLVLRFTVWREIIVAGGKWLWNSTTFFVACFCSLFFCLDRAQNTIVVLYWLRNWPMETFRLRNNNHVIMHMRMSDKQKDFARSWIFQHKSWRLLFCSFDVCRAS